MYWSFWGMNIAWWFFWVALLVVFFATLTPVPRRRVRIYSDPLAILRRRYAAGEITTAEYEERKAILSRDAGQRFTEGRPTDKRSDIPSAAPTTHASSGATT